MFYETINGFVNDIRNHLMFYGNYQWFRTLYREPLYNLRDYQRLRITDMEPIDVLRAHPYFRKSTNGSI